MKTAIAARAAAHVRTRHPDAEVETERGGLLELSVRVDGEEVYSAGRLGYPPPKRMAGAVRPGAG